jgi:hypothetical protein
MLTGQELIHALLVPALLAGFLAAIARWRRWAWAMPLATGAGFLAGYALLRFPGLPPRDGTDWLFWLTIPLTLLAILSSIGGSDTLVRHAAESGDVLVPRADAKPARWTWTFGAAAGLVALVIMLPLTRVGSVSTTATIATTLPLAIAGAALTFLLRFAVDRLGPLATLLSLCITLAGAGVIVMASNLRIVGIYGLAAAAALAPVSLLSRDPRAARALSILTIPLLAGLLTAGHYYPDPGLSWLHFLLILCAPLLLIPAAALPIKSNRTRAAIAMIAIATFVGAITIPNALAAKKAAEEDPYSSY